MIRSPSSYTMRCISKDVLFFPYLPSKELCIKLSLHVVPIFYHSLGSLVCLYFCSDPWESSSMSSFFVAPKRHNSTIWKEVIALGWDHGKTHLCSFRMQGRLGSWGTKLCSFRMQVNAAVWGPWRTHFAISGCKAGWADEGQNFVVLWCKTLLWDEALGGHICAVLGWKVNWEAKIPRGQNCAISRDNGFPQREWH